MIDLKKGEGERAEELPRCHTSTVTTGLNPLLSGMLQDSIGSPRSNYRGSAPPRADDDGGTNRSRAGVKCLNLDE